MERKCLKFSGGVNRVSARVSVLPRLNLWPLLGIEHFKSQRQFEIEQKDYLCSQVILKIIAVMTCRKTGPLQQTDLSIFWIPPCARVMDMVST